MVYRVGWEVNMSFIGLFDTKNDVIRPAAYTLPSRGLSNTSEKVNTCMANLLSGKYTRETLLFSPFFPSFI